MSEACKASESLQVSEVKSYQGQHSYILVCTNLFFTILEDELPYKRFILLSTI